MRWIKHIIICLLSGFVLLFGIQMLIAAWKLKNPYEFFICFISSSFIIFISAALFFGLIYRMLWCGKEKEDSDENKYDNV
jgi:hypothetical protein